MKLFIAINVFRGSFPSVKHCLYTCSRHYNNLSPPTKRHRQSLKQNKVRALKPPFNAPVKVNPDPLTPGQFYRGAILPITWGNFTDQMTKSTPLQGDKIWFAMLIEWILCCMYIYDCIPVFCMLQLIISKEGTLKTYYTNVYLSTELILCTDGFVSK